MDSTQSVSQYYVERDRVIYVYTPGVKHYIQHGRSLNNHLILFIICKYCNRTGPTVFARHLPGHPTRSAKLSSPGCEPWALCTTNGALTGNAITDQLMYYTCWVETVLPALSPGSLPRWRHCWSLYVSANQVILTQFGYNMLTVVLSGKPAIK